jgi:hypothetical protein
MLVAAGAIRLAAAADALGFIGFQQIGNELVGLGF